MSMDIAALKTPFAATDIEWRIGRAGTKDGKPWAKCLAYITSRAIMDRLDDVCGPENWQCAFRSGEGHMMAGIALRKDRDEWIWKWDGTGMLDARDGFSGSDAGKGDFSNAFKRAAVQWGIGRYLYAVPEQWAVVSDGGRYYGKTKEGGFHWDPPRLPEHALPHSTAKVGAVDSDTERMAREVRELLDRLNGQLEAKAVEAAHEAVDQRDSARLRAAVAFLTDRLKETA